MLFCREIRRPAMLQLLCAYEQRCWLSQFRRGVANSGIGINERDMHGLTPLWCVGRLID